MMNLKRWCVVVAAVAAALVVAWIAIVRDQELYASLRGQDLDSARLWLTMGADPNESRVRVASLDNGVAGLNLLAEQGLVINSGLLQIFAMIPFDGVPASTVKEMFDIIAARVPLDARIDPTEDPSFCSVVTPLVASLFLERGADPRMKCTFHEAVWGKRGPVAEVLLTAGADPNARKTHTGETTLHVCDAEAAAVFLKHGADPNLKDNKGRTALDAAEERGDSEAAAVLQRHGALRALYVGADHARSAGRTASELRDLRQGSGTFATPDQCSISGRGDAGSSILEGDRSWSAIAGTRLIVDVRCPMNGFIHWAALVQNRSPLPQEINRFLLNGRARFTIDLQDPWEFVQLYFYHSDRAIEHLGEAVSRLRARAVGYRTVSVGVVQKASRDRGRTRTSNPR